MPIAAGADLDGGRAGGGPDEEPGLGWDGGRCIGGGAGGGVARGDTGPLYFDDAGGGGGGGAFRMTLDGRFSGGVTAAFGTGVGSRNWCPPVPAADEWLPLVLGITERSDCTPLGGTAAAEAGGGWNAGVEENRRGDASPLTVGGGGGGCAVFLPGGGGGGADLPGVPPELNGGVGGSGFTRSSAKLWRRPPARTDGGTEFVAGGRGGNENPPFSWDSGTGGNLNVASAVASMLRDRCVLSDGGGGTGATGKTVYHTHVYFITGENKGKSGEILRGN